MNTVVKTITSNFKKIVLGTILIAGSQLSAYAQIDSAGGGVSFSPGRIFFRTGLGKTETKYVTLSNSSTTARSFVIKLTDFDMNDDGKKGYSPAGKNEYSITKWLTVSPSFLELKPGQTQKVALILNIPDDPAAAVSSWCTLMMSMVNEKKKLAPLASTESMGIGVTSSMGFAAQIYQNPPIMTGLKLELLGFKKFYPPKDTSGNTHLILELNNPSNYTAQTRIGLEFLNQSTGKKSKLPVKELAILPKHKRRVVFNLPADIEKGNYTVSAVVDYGNKDEILTAEMEFQK